MSSDNVQALTSGTRLGDYRLDAVIGHGGFGITYRAFDTQLAKFVAIKEYLPVEFAVRDDGKVVARGTRFAEDFAWGRERFLDEARALARFRHPHIVPVLRYFEANGTAYTVMEFEDGKSVGELLRQPAGRLSPDDVQRLADGLVGGLSAVHAQGFLHRDIKPSNIIIRRDGIPVLIDFGAARQAMGERTRTMTGVLTPQYAPIEQYALDGKQGPWSDIYSAAAVLHHAIAGQPPPDAAARVGTDPYRPLATTHADRFGPAFLGAIDRALAFAPADRPQSVEEWAALFGLSIARVADAPTQRLGSASGATPRLGGASREVDPPALPPPVRRSRTAVWAAVLLVVVVGAAAAWLFKPQLQATIAGAPSVEQPVATATPTPTPPLVSQPAPTLTPTPTPTPATRPAPAVDAPKQALIEQGERAAVAARAVLERADEAARAARAMAGEARIVAARAARPDLQNAERLTNDGVSYVGQVSDGKRQGLGVVELSSGERQAGDFQDDRLNGLGTVRFQDDARYAGQWRDGQATGLGAREKPGVDRAEGNFVAGRLEGLGVRRTLTEPATVQSGEFRAGLLEGPGVESMGDQRYEGGFRAGKRHGFGQVTSADGKVQSGRWEDGKAIETTP